MAAIESACMLTNGEALSVSYFHTATLVRLVSDDLMSEEAYYRII